MLSWDDDVRGLLAERVCCEDLFDIAFHRLYGARGTEGGAMSWKSTEFGSGHYCPE